MKWWWQGQQVRFVGNGFCYEDIVELDRKFQREQEEWTEFVRIFIRPEEKTSLGLAAIMKIKTETYLR